MRTETSTTRHTRRSAVGREPDRRAHPSASNRARLPGGRPEEPSASFDKSDTGGFSHLLRTLPLSIALTSLVGLAALTVSAWVAHRSADPSAWVMPLSLAALAVTSLVGGMIAGRLHRASSTAAGLLSGGVFAVGLLLLSFAVGEGGLPPLAVWLPRPGVILLHALGGRLVRPRTPRAEHTAGGHRTHR